MEIKIHIISTFTFSRNTDRMGKLEALQQKNE